MSRRGENIYKRRDGRWEGRYIIGRTSDGKAIYKSIYSKSYREIRERIRIAKQTSADLCSPDKSSAAAAFGEIADKWLASKKSITKESTYVKYRNMLHKYIYPVFQNMQITDITYDKVEAFVNELLTVGGVKQNGLSEKTVADIVSIMREVGKYAINHGIHVNTSNMDMKIKHKVQELDILSRSEEETLIEYLENDMDCRKFGIYLCLFTGIRIGELCALTWQDVSVDEKVLHIHSSMQRIQITDSISNRKTHITISSPKSICSVRKIPLPEKILAIISSRFKEREGYVLTGNNRKYVEPRLMEYHFRKVCNKCCIRPVKFHALRHTFATRSIEAGCDVKSISEILGHSCVNMTMNRYVHPSMELKRKSIEKHYEMIAVRN